MIKNKYYKYSQEVNPKMQKVKFTLFFNFILYSIMGLAQSDGVNFKIFPIHELKEDFNFWRERIEKKHPLLYLYQPKRKIDRCFDSLYQEINRPMTEIEFMNLLTPATALIQDGHNHITPSETALDQIRKYKYLLPLELKFINERLFVIQDLSSSEESLTGLDITSINSVTSQEMFLKFLANMARDGNNYQYPIANINKSFRYYFHTHFGFTNEYLITYLNKKNKENTCSIPGKSLDSIQKVKLLRYPKAEDTKASGLKFNIIDSIQTAVLSINTFSPHKSNRRFKKEITNYFKEIKIKKIANLIIDLRDNGGGNPNLVKFILQHLFDHPFEQAKECRVVKHRLKENFSERTKKRWYPWYGIGTFKPKKNNFKGNIFVLVNEGTFSAGVIFASVLKKYNRAVFIGNETGGNPIIMAGYLINTSWKLPNTKIQISPGTLCTIYDDLNLNQGRGLVPKYLINTTAVDLISNNDRTLDYTIKLICESK
ncbi:MAG: hypothetical protein IPO62_13580 [Saprospiraceae bacterium]|nr:hypothetical protein [Saprospiraceae bacterium]